MSVSHGAVSPAEGTDFSNKSKATDYDKRLPALRAFLDHRPVHSPPAIPAKRAKRPLTWRLRPAWHLETVWTTTSLMQLGGVSEERISASLTEVGSGTKERFACRHICPFEAVAEEQMLVFPAKQLAPSRIIYLTTVSVTWLMENCSMESICKSYSGQRWT